MIGVQAFSKPLAFMASSTATSSGLIAPRTASAFALAKPSKNLRTATRSGSVAGAFSSGRRILSLMPSSFMSCAIGVTVGAGGGGGGGGGGGATATGASSS